MVGWGGVGGVDIVEVWWGLYMTDTTTVSLCPTTVENNNNNNNSGWFVGLFIDQIDDPLDVLVVPLTATTWQSCV